MKKKLPLFFFRHFCFDELCFDVDQLWTDKLFLDLNNDELIVVQMMPLFVDTLNDDHLQLFFVEHQLFVQSEMLKDDLNEEHVQE